MKIFTDVFDWLLYCSVVPRGFIIPPVPAEPASELDPSYSSTVGVYDMHLNGWISNHDGIHTLYPSFAISADDIVVDIGCGEADFLYYAGSSGAHVVAADINPDKVNAAVKRLKTTAARQVDGVVGDSNPLNIQDAFATRVICTEVIEHVEDPAQFLSELFRIGQPGALYLLTVPDSASEYAQKNSIAPESCFEYPNHIRIIERADFKKMVEDSGLVVERHESYGFFNALWWAFFWYCPSEKDVLQTSDPLALSWAKTWHMFLSLPKSDKVRAQLEHIYAKSQIIIARKPLVQNKTPLPFRTTIARYFYKLWK